MQAHHYLYVFGIVVSTLLAFGGFYNSVINRKFDALEAWMKDHERKFEAINGRCMAEVVNIAKHNEKMESIIDRLDKIEAKLDRVLNGGVHDRKS